MAKTKLTKNIRQFCKLLIQMIPPQPLPTSFLQLSSRPQESMFLFCISTSATQYLGFGQSKLTKRDITLKPYSFQTNEKEAPHKNSQRRNGHLISEVAIRGAVHGNSLCGPSAPPLCPEETSSECNLLDTIPAKRSTDLWEKPRWCKACCSRKSSSIQNLGHEAPSVPSQHLSRTPSTPNHLSSLTTLYRPSTSSPHANKTTQPPLFANKIPSLLLKLTSKPHSHDTRETSSMKKSTPIVVKN